MHAHADQAWPDVEATHNCRGVDNFWKVGGGANGIIIWKLIANNHLFCSLKN